MRGRGTQAIGNREQEWPEFLQGRYNWELGIGNWEWGMNSRMKQFLRDCLRRGADAAPARENAAFADANYGVPTGELR